MRGLGMDWCRDFLVGIGVYKLSAELDAEGIEHHAETLAAFRRHLER